MKTADKPLRTSLAGDDAAPAAPPRSRRRPPTAVMYFVSFAAVPLFGFIQTKVLTILLPQSSVGDIQLVLPILSICLLLGGLGIPNYILRFFSRNGASAFRESAGLALIATTCTSIIAIVATKGFTFLSARRWTIVALGAVFVVEVLSEQLFALAKVLLRVRERHKMYNALVIVERVGSVAGVIVGVVLLRSAAVEGYLLGSGLGTLAVLASLWLRRPSDIFLIPTAPSSGRVREVLVYGLPVVAIVVASSLLVSSSRYVIVSAGMGTDAVARYVVSGTVATLGMQGLYEPTLTYIHPRIFRKWEDQDSRGAQRLWRRYLLLYTVAGIAVIMMFLAGQTLLTRLVANASYETSPIVFAWLLVNAFLMGIYRFVATHYLVTKRTFELAIVFGGALVLNVAGALVLIRTHGLAGVAAAAAVSSALLSLVVWWRGRRVLPLTSRAAA